MIRTQQLRSVQDVLDIYGNGAGCEICKPALSYLVDVVWCGDHEEDRSARFINDRVHANIQNDGTFSVIPRIRGGVTSPAELRRIANAAEKYNARMVKITGSHASICSESGKPICPRSGRISECLQARLCERCSHGEDLRGNRVLPFRCAGRDFRRRRTRTAAGESFYAAQDQNGRDGLPAQLRRSHGERYRPCRTGRQLAGGGWRSGGKACSQSGPADYRRNDRSRRLEAASLFFQYYRENANYLERTYDFVERLGIEKVRKETVYAPEKHGEALLKRLQKAKALSSDVWLERQNPVNPTQFVQIEAMEMDRGKWRVYCNELDSNY